MLPTIIVGVIFFGIVGIGIYKSIKAMRNNSCPGCSGGCTEQAKNSCDSKK
ncbi:FeoB-associated Cys-rich membrane protein [Alkalibaculum sp. M08DMB]|uniref:FeoB-associated Cys-rich membrane protein n=1 Tax=Alkalibaculum sporogenes TaxID=2655001 RepID=A0A6A7K860_9FIRM|nr:FeoB-associated Cys-rich membrane protein [Alkalibaculum sporogenes]MPW25566.1 FeoB-associated Cys-rich membrane protein [Alkalibaculum sporogenes]